MSSRNKEAEAAFLEAYDASAFERPSTAVDTVIFTVLHDALHVLLVQRAEHPYKDCWSLVGGYVDIHRDRTLKETAKRKLEEKTGVKTPYLEQFETIGNKERDPRGWSITTVYFALIPSQDITLRSGKGAVDIKWLKVEGGQVTEELAFDHAEILQRCTERLRNKVLYTSLPVYLMPKLFTLGELQKVYELILGSPIEHKSFRRRMLGAEILEESGEMSYSSKRPAILYQLKKSQDPYFFVRNLEAAGKSAAGVDV